MKNRVEVRSIMLRAGKALVLPLAVFVLFSLLSGGRFGTSTLPTLFRQAAITAMLSWPLFLTMQLGGWNFSIASIVYLTSILSGTIVNTYQLSLVHLVLLCVVIATILSALVGLCCVLLKVPSILVTIGCLMIFESMTSQLNGARGATIRGSITILAKSPYVFIMTAICGVITYVIYYKTSLGYHIRAVGNAYLTSKAIGIPIERTRVLTFFVSGILLGIGTVVYFSNNSRMSPVSNMESMATNFSAMIGMFLGNYIARYCNNVVAIYIACLTMKMLASGLVAIGLPSTFQDIITGLFLIIFIGIVSNQKKMDQFLSDRKRAQQITASGLLTDRNATGGNA